MESTIHTAKSSDERLRLLTPFFLSPLALKLRMWQGIQESPGKSFPSPKCLIALANLDDFRPTSCDGLMKYHRKVHAQTLKSFLRNELSVSQGPFGQGDEKGSIEMIEMIALMLNLDRPVKTSWSFGCEGCWTPRNLLGICGSKENLESL